MAHVRYQAFLAAALRRCPAVSAYTASSYRLGYDAFISYFIASHAASISMYLVLIRCRDLSMNPAGASLCCSRHVALLSQLPQRHTRINRLSWTRETWKPGIYHDKANPRGAPFGSAARNLTSLM